jgi:hypothetical protein
MTRVWLGNVVTLISRVSLASPSFLLSPKSPSSHTLLTLAAMVTVMMMLDLCDEKHASSLDAPR